MNDGVSIGSSDSKGGRGKDKANAAKGCSREEEMSLGDEDGGGLVGKKEGKGKGKEKEKEKDEKKKEESGDKVRIVDEKSGLVVVLSTQDSSSSPPSSSSKIEKRIFPIYVELSSNFMTSHSMEYDVTTTISDVLSLTKKRARRRRGEIDNDEEKRAFEKELDSLCVWQVFPADRERERLGGEERLVDVIEGEGEGEGERRYVCHLVCADFVYGPREGEWETVAIPSWRSK